MPTTDTFRPSPGTTVDGEARREGVNESFATIRAGAGTSALDNSADLVPGYLAASATSNQFQRLIRGLFLFDSSAIPDADSIFSASLTLYGSNTILGATKLNTIGSPDLVVVPATPASNTALVAADYGQVGTTDYGRITYAAWSATHQAANVISLNAAGLAAISKTGITKLGTTLGWDADGSFTGTWSSWEVSAFGCYFSDQAGTSLDPLLTVVHGVPASLVHTRSQFRAISGLTMQHHPRRGR